MRLFALLQVICDVDRHTLSLRDTCFADKLGLEMKTEQRRSGGDFYHQAGPMTI